MLFDGVLLVKKCSLKLRFVIGLDGAEISAALETVFL